VPSKQNPITGKPIRCVAEALSKLKKYSEALSDCQKLIQTNAASPASYSSRAEVYRDMSKSESGEVDMEIAFKIKAVLWQVEP
jgi:hypothetical protein